MQGRPYLGAASRMGYCSQEVRMPLHIIVNAAVQFPLRS
jgi:hypothetical protein